MQYRTLGRTGVQVSTLSLGAMNFGAIGRTTQDEATAIVDAAPQPTLQQVAYAEEAAPAAGSPAAALGAALIGAHDPEPEEVLRYG